MRRTAPWGVLTFLLAMFTKASSIDDIVDMAHMLILDAVGARLLPS